MSDGDEARVYSELEELLIQASTYLRKRRAEEIEGSSAGQKDKETFPNGGTGDNVH